MRNEYCSGCGHFKGHHVFGEGQCSFKLFSPDNFCTCKQFEEILHKNRIIEYPSEICKLILVNYPHNVTEGFAILLLNNLENTWKKKVNLAGLELNI